MTTTSSSSHVFFRSPLVRRTVNCNTPLCQSIFFLHTRHSLMLNSRSWTRLLPSVVYQSQSSFHSPIETMATVTRAPENCKLNKKKSSFTARAIENFRTFLCSPVNTMKNFFCNTYFTVNVS